MNEVKWLVKSSGKILGPMTLEAIAERIRSRTVSIFDEVREPLTRWTMVREHPQLFQVVRQIRDEHATILENTQSTFVSGSKTLTSSVTEKLAEDSGITPNPFFDDQMVSIQGSEKTLTGGGIASRGYGSLEDQNVQARMRRIRSRWMAVAYGLGVLCLIGATVIWRVQRASHMTAEQAEEYFKLAQ
ncbi:MAG: hypothetical protein C5B49_10645, partial [Bdellovibrio sp.]